MLCISEIFHSIQGESLFVGRPCVFVRLAGCNLHCTYCDTRYARQGGTSLSMSKILQMVNSYKTNLVEITGGEPLLQSETPRLVNKLLTEKKEVLVETNGSLDVSVLPSRAVKIVDIKCPSSDQSKKMQWQNLNVLKSHDQVKFVIATRKDYNWAKQQIQIRKIQKICPVLLSPVWQKLKPATLAVWLLKDRLPVRLQVQLHKVIWPHRKRGI